MRSGPERGQRSRVTIHVPTHFVVRLFFVRVLPVSREDKSLSEERPGERGLAVWTVGVVIWPR